jgi:hypothetical protein
MPILENIKQDPFERLPVSNVLEGSPGYFNDFYAREFWRFVYVQQKVGELAQTAIDFPPMQKGAATSRQSRSRWKPQSPRGNLATETLREAPASFANIDSINLAHRWCGYLSATRHRLDCDGAQREV